jgi:hypothetical protein
MLSLLSRNQRYVYAFAAGVLTVVGVLLLR